MPLPRPGDPAFEGAVLAAIRSHPSMKQKPDGSFSFSLQAYNEIGAKFGITNDKVSIIAQRNGIVRRASSGPGPAPDGVPIIGKSTEPKKKTDKLKNAQIVTLFAVGFHSLYSLIAQFEGKHWELREDEADDAAGELKRALDTLEGEDYEKAIALLSRAAPWASLGVCLWTITKPRLERTRTDKATRKHVESTRGLGPDPGGGPRGPQDTGPHAQAHDGFFAVGDYEEIGLPTLADVDGRNEGT
jgi:hypothetical protein